MKHMALMLNNLPSDSKEFTMLLERKKKMKVNLKWRHKNTSRIFMVMTVVTCSAGPVL